MTLDLLAQYLIDLLRIRLQHWEAMALLVQQHLGILVIVLDLFGAAPALPGVQIVGWGLAKNVDRASGAATEKAFTRDPGFR